MNSSRPSLTSVSSRYFAFTYSKPCSDCRLVSSMNSNQAAKGNKRSAPEMRCVIETTAATGMRISKRSAGRLRYFGRIFFADALAMETARPLIPGNRNYNEIESRPRSSNAKSANARRRHRRRRPDRLLPAVSHCERRNARQGPAGDPADARDPGREGAEGAQGRDDGARRLRVSPEI